MLYQIAFSWSYNTMQWHTYVINQTKVERFDRILKKSGNQMANGRGNVQVERMKLQGNWGWMEGFWRNQGTKWQMTEVMSNLKGWSFKGQKFIRKSITYYFWLHVESFYRWPPGYLDVFYMYATWGCNLFFEYQKLSEEDLGELKSMQD